MKILSGCFVILAVVLSLPLHMMPQGVAISSNTNYQAEGSSILDVMSDSKGILIPRLTGAQRASIAEPATGLMVFDTDIDAFCFYDGASWQYLITKAYADSLKQEVKLEIYAELGVDDIDGFRYNGSFWDYGYTANWWSSTENTSLDCWARKIYYYGAYIYADANVKNIGFSVRCLKNQ
jgi:hypothetical protein